MFSTNKKKTQIMKTYLKSILPLIVIMIFSCKENNGTIKVDAPEAKKIVEIYQIERIEPPNWWVGFVNTNLQLLVKHPNISKAKDVLIDYPGVTVKKIHKADSPNYRSRDRPICKTWKIQYHI